LTCRAAWLPRVKSAKQTAKSSSTLHLSVNKGQHQVPDKT
jgi:hypothetical protein